MNNRQGAKKMYKTHRGWLVAGLAAAMLAAPALIGTQHVSAADGDPAVSDVAADPAVAQAELNAAVQGIIDVVNGADLSTAAGFAAAQEAVGQHSAAMQAATTAGGDMAAVPADLMAQMQAALGKLADAQKQSVLQSRLNTAVQTIIDAVKNNDLSTSAGYSAASAVAQQQSMAMQEAVDAGAKTEDIPANLQTALKDALAELAAVQKQSVLQERLNNAVQTIIDAVNQNDLSTSAGYNAASTVAQQQSVAMQEAVDAGAKIADIPADKQTELKDALQKLSDIQKPMIAQDRMNAAAQAMIDAVNAADLTTPEGYKAASETVSQQEQAMADAQAAGATTDAIPANLYADLQSALAKLRAAQPKASVTVHFRDAAGNELKPATTLKDIGLPGGTVDMSAQAIDTEVDGYQLQSILHPVVLSETGNDIYLEYLAEPQSVTMHFQDATSGIELKSPTTLPNVGVTGETVDLSAQGLDTAIDGYDLQSILNPAYTLKSSGNDVTLLYLADAQSVTIHYQDATTGKELKSPTTLPNVGLTGETVDLSEQGLDTAIDGYALQSILNPAYTLKASGNEITLLYLADAQTVTIHYQDATTGKELKSPTTLPNIGLTGETVDLSAQGLDTAIDGYALQSTLNPAYTIKVSGNDVTLLYLAEPQSVTIHYQDATTGKELKQPTILSNVGLTDETVDLTTKGIDTAIAGYDLQNALSAAYTLTAGANDVTLLYDAQTQSVTVHYQDATTGKVLKDPTTLSNLGVTGATVDLTKQGLDTAIAGYDLQNALSTAYTLKAGANDVTLLYDAQAQSVTVHYQDATTGKELQPATTLSNLGVTGATVDLTKQGLDIAIAGYDLQNELSAAYTLKADNNEVTLRYAAQTQTITIHYQDATTGNELKDATILSDIGVTGAIVDLTTQSLDTTIAGYELQSLLNDAYTLQADHNDITLLYLAQPQSLTIHYQSATTGEELKEATTLANVGLTGETIDLTAQSIDTSVYGYALQSVLNDAYTLQADGNDITLEYVGEPQKLIVHFVVAGSEMPLIADQIFDAFGVTGDVVDLTKLGIDAVDGFTMKTLLPTDFTVVAGDNEITLEFTKDPEPTPTPGKTPTPETGNNGNQTPPTDQQHHGDKHGDHNKKPNTQAALPQNGDNTNSVATVAGLGIITALLTLMGIDIKKRHA